jgi:hypothetical protein
MHTIQRLSLGTILTIVSLLVTCTNTNENPAISATNETNQTGGTIQVTGSNFTPRDPVSVSILNVPGIAKPWSEAAGVADPSGNINVTISYSYDPTSQPALPGCVIGNQTNYLTALNVTAADSNTNKFATTQVQVRNCAWAVPQVTSHQ